MTKATETTGIPGFADLDRVNFEQALVDVEVANARVVDLTGRLTTMAGELLARRAEVGNLELVVAQERAEAAQLRAQLADARNSVLHRVRRRLGKVANRVAR